MKHIIIDSYSSSLYMVVEDDGKEREGEGLLHYLDKSISFSRSLEVKGGV